MLDGGAAIGRAARRTSPIAEKGLSALWSL